MQDQPEEILGKKDAAVHLYWLSTLHNVYIVEKWSKYRPTVVAEGNIARFFPQNDYINN